MQNLLLTVLVGVVAVGGVWYVVEQKSEVSEEADLEKEETEQMSEEDLSGMGSFSSLMGLGRNLTCDFSYSASDAGGAVAGTVYIAGENIRGDFEMEQAGEVYKSHMIQDGEMAYTWTTSSQGTFAFKSEINKAETEASAQYSANAADRSMDLSQEVDYKCRTWNKDESKFVPPSNINFLSPEDMIQGFDLSQFQQ